MGIIYNYFIIIYVDQYILLLNQILLIMSSFFASLIPNSNSLSNISDANNNNNNNNQFNNNNLTITSNKKNKKNLSAEQKLRKIMNRHSNTIFYTALDELNAIISTPFENVVAEYEMDDNINDSKMNDIDNNNNNNNNSVTNNNPHHNSFDLGNIVSPLLQFRKILQHFHNPKQAIPPETRRNIALMLKSTVQTINDMKELVQRSINNSFINNLSVQSKVLRFIEPKIHCARINNSNEYDLVFDWSHKLIIDENIPSKGRGVRAAVHIPANSAIRYYGENINRATMERRRKAGKSSYILQIKKDHFIDGHPDLDLPKNMCIAGLINEPSVGERVNCRLSGASGADYIVIAVDIEAGEELLMSYGVLGCSRNYPVGDLTLPTTTQAKSITNNNKKQRTKLTQPTLQSQFEPLSKS